MRDIIIVGLQAWDLKIGSNCKNIAIELSKRNRVLYINRPYNRNIFFTRKKAKDKSKYLKAIGGKQKNQVQKIKENLWVYQPLSILESIGWIKINWLFNMLNRMNNRRVAKEIVKAHKYLKFKQILFFNDNDFINYVYVKNYIIADRYIFYIRDYLTSQEYFKRRDYLELETIKNSDVVFTNSIFLRNYTSKWNSNSHFVGQGCDFTLFSKDKLLVPKDIKGIPGKKIGYAGMLSAERLDIALTFDLATNLPQFSFILVGFEDDQFKSSPLHRLQNVYFLGGKKPEEIPSYINMFDICINPQKINELTIGNYPRKIDEYLALGKPVLATQTDAMDYFKKHVYLGVSEEDFRANVYKAIDEDSDILAYKRRKFAMSHTWENSVGQMYSVLKI